MSTITYFVAFEVMNYSSGIQIHQEILNDEVIYDMGMQGIENIKAIESILKAKYPHFEKITILNWQRFEDE